MGTGERLVEVWYKIVSDQSFWTVNCQSINNYISQIVSCVDLSYMLCYM